MEEKREELQATLVAAFSYPAFLIVFSVAVVIFILGFVFPKFAVLFSSIRDQLPPTTLMLMWISDLLQERSWLVAGGGLTAAVAGVAWVGSPAGAQAIHDVTTRLPLLRQVFLQIYLIQSMRIMGLSLDNGVPFLDALNVCKGAVRNQTFRQFMESLCSNVTKGHGFAAGFNDANFCRHWCG